MYILLKSSKSIKIKNMYSKFSHNKTQMCYIIEEYSSKILNEFYRQKIQYNEVLNVI